MSLLSPYDPVAHALSADVAEKVFKWTGRMNGFFSANFGPDNTWRPEPLIAFKDEAPASLKALGYGHTTEATKGAYWFPNGQGAARKPMGRKRYAVPDFARNMNAAWAIVKHLRRPDANAEVWPRFREALDHMAKQAAKPGNVKDLGRAYPPDSDFGWLIQKADKPARAISLAALYAVQALSLSAAVKSY